MKPTYNYIWATKYSKSKWSSLFQIRDLNCVPTPPMDAAGGVRKSMLNGFRFKEKKTEVL